MAPKQTSTGTSEQMSRSRASRIQTVVELVSPQRRRRAQQQQGQEQQRDQAEECDTRWTQLLQQLEVRLKGLLAGELGNAWEIEMRAQPQQSSQAQQKLTAEILIDLLFDMRAIGLLNYQRIGEILRRYPEDQSQFMSDLKNILKGKSPARGIRNDQESGLNNLIDRFQRFESQTQQQGHEVLAPKQQRDELLRLRKQLRALMQQVQAEYPVFDDVPGRSRPTKTGREFYKVMQEVEAEFRLFESLPVKDPALILACRVGEKLEILAQIYELEAITQEKHAREAEQPQGQSSSRQQQGIPQQPQGQSSSRQQQQEQQGIPLQQRVELLVLVQQAETQSASLRTMPKRGQMARRYDSTGPELQLIKARIETLQTRDQALMADKQLREIINSLSQMAEALQQDRQQPEIQPQQSLPPRSQQGRPTERTIGSDRSRACCRIS